MRGAKSRIGSPMYNGVQLVGLPRYLVRAWYVKISFTADIVDTCKWLEVVYESGVIHREVCAVFVLQPWGFGTGSMQGNESSRSSRMDAILLGG